MGQSGWLAVFLVHWILKSLDMSVLLSQQSNSAISPKKWCVFPVWKHKKQIFMSKLKQEIYRKECDYDTLSWLNGVEEVGLSSISIGVSFGLSYR